MTSKMSERENRLCRDERSIFRRFNDSGTNDKSSIYEKTSRMISVLVLIKGRFPTQNFNAIPASSLNTGINQITKIRYFQCSYDQCAVYTIDR